MKLSRLVWWLVILVGLLSWEGVRRFDLVNAVVLASPSEIWRAFRSDGIQFLEALQLTLTEMGIAIVITWVLGIATGLMAGVSARASATVGPILTSLFAIPLVTFYPLFMIWFGLGPASKIAFGTFMGFFAVALNTLYGVRLGNAQFVLLGRSIGASRRQILLRIRLPLAVPAVVSGLRIGTSLVVIGVLVSEMLASLGGIGFLISYNRTLFNTGHVYLGIALALTTVLLVNGLLSRVEKHFERWRDLEAAPK